MATGVVNKALMEEQIDDVNSNETPIDVNAGGEPTVKTSFIPLVCFTDRKIL